MFRRIFLNRLYSLSQSHRFLNLSQKYLFSQIKNHDGKEEIITVLKRIPFENGKNLVESNYIVDMQVKEDGSVSILLRLDQNYRKIKNLCQTELLSIPWIKNLSINMAPKVNIFFKKNYIIELFYRNKKQNSLKREG